MSQRTKEQARRRNKQRLVNYELGNARWLGLLPRPHFLPEELGDRQPTPEEFAERRRAFVQKHGSDGVKRRFRLTWAAIFPELDDDDA